MIDRGDACSRGRPVTDPFLERVRRALDHDLRTPLGTIVNYATILESQTEAKSDDVRVFAGRIRSNAVRTAKMLRHVAEALTLSERAPSEHGFDPSGLVRALVSELPLHVRFPARGVEPTDPILFDRELLAFSWRAFLAVNSEAGTRHALELDIEVHWSEIETAIDMWVGTRPAPTPAHVGSSKFAEEALEVVPPESCFALGLAEELVRRRGGDFGLWGQPGRAAGLRIAFAAKR
jgi:hypothetical protein